MAKGISQIISPAGDILGTGFWCGLKELFILSGAQHGSMVFFFTTAVALHVPASYGQMNWFWLQVISPFFTQHNSYSGSHSGCSFWTKFLNQVRWGKSQLGAVSDCITSLQSAYCDCCPICKLDWQSQGHIAGWGDLMLSCTSGRPSSGFRACMWGSRHSWCWRRDMIPQCKWESLYWPSDIACSTLQQIWDQLILGKSAVCVFWIGITCCHWGMGTAKMPLIALRVAFNVV